MRVGELLTAAQAVDPVELARAIDEQPYTTLRLASLLISRGALDPDAAATALAAQLGVAPALRRHLEARDHRLIARLSAELARSFQAVPIARTRDDKLVVVMCDPRPEQVAALERALAASVRPAVAAALVIERLVADVYGAPPTDEVDVDFDVKSTPTAMAFVDDGLDALALVDLDDQRVHRDPAQSGVFALPNRPGATLPPATAPARTGTTAPPPLGVAKTGTTSPPPLGVARTGSTAPPPFPGRVASTTTPPFGAPAGATLVQTLETLALVTNHGAATDAVMAYLVGAYATSLLLAIEDGAAVGERGHGGQLTPEAIEALTIPLTASTIVRAAHDARGLVAAPPPDTGVVHDRLVRLLGSPRALVATPLMIGPRVVGVVVAGDPRPAVQPRDIVAVANALAAAYARAQRRSHQLYGED